MRTPSSHTANSKDRDRGKKTPQKGKGKKERSSCGHSDQGGLPRFLDLSGVDWLDCPRFKSVVERDTEQDPVGVDELDKLQSELENVLLNCARRSRALREELNDLTDGGRATPIPSSKIKITIRTPKKECESKGKGEEEIRSAMPLTKPMKLKREASEESVEFNQQPGTSHASDNEHKSSTTTKKLPRKRGGAYRYFLPANDFPDKFWKFVDEYCKPCSQEDVEHLEDMLAQYDLHESELLQNVDGKSKQQRRGSERAVKGRTRARQSSGANDASPPTKKRKSNETAVAVNGDTKGAHLGPLSERLVQALLNQKPALIAATDEDSKEEMQLSKGDKNASVHAGLLRTLKLPNFESLEKRIKEELIEHGLLEAQDSLDAEGDMDEVSRELRQREAELRAVTQRNRDHVQRLLVLAQTDLRRQKLKSQLNVLNEAVVEMCNKYCNAHPRKRPNKKEKDQIWKLLKERNTLVEQLEELGAPSSQPVSGEM